MLLTVTIEPTFAKVGASPVPLPCLKVSGAKFNHFSLNSCFYGSLGKGNGPVSHSRIGILEIIIFNFPLLYYALY